MLYSTRNYSSLIPTGTYLPSSRSSDRGLNNVQPTDESSLATHRRAFGTFLQESHKRQTIIRVRVPPTP
jgi:hypothetical protein